MVEKGRTYPKWNGGRGGGLGRGGSRRGKSLGYWQDFGCVRARDPFFLKNVIFAGE